MAFLQDYKVLHEQGLQIDHIIYRGQTIWPSNYDDPLDYSTPFWIEQANSTWPYQTILIGKHAINGGISGVTLNDITFEYSTNKLNWDTLGTVTDDNNIEFQLAPHTRIYLRANCETLSKSYYNGILHSICTQIERYSFGTSLRIGGNILSLIYGSNFEQYNTVRQGEYYSGFASLFSHLGTADDTVNYSTYADKLLLPTQCTVNYEYSGMLHYCKTAPILPATSLTEGCYYRMFSVSPSLDYVKCFATDISAENCTYDWLRDVSSTGTFVKAAGATWPTGTSGIPSGWTVQEV